MTAKILVVDDIDANVRLLEAKLTAEYYDVITATSGQQALEQAKTHQPDVILLDIMMPGMDGFECCQLLKADDVTRHIPVVMVTALDGRNDRIKGLEVGANDFITKPFDDAILMARVKSLVRFKQVVDELRQREAEGRKIGVIDGVQRRGHGTGGRILILDDRERQAERLKQHLSEDHRPFIEASPDAAKITAQGPLDLVIINAVNADFDGLRVTAQIRSDPFSRTTPILVIADVDERARMVKALEIGADDIITRPIDQAELLVRVSTLVKRKRYADALKQNLDQGLEKAVTDQLTGLFNRHYLDTQLQPLVSRAAADGPSVSALLLDIDHFKRVNDTFGHDVGDEVLREFALRLAANTRAIDVACRMGGEEFIIIMPETDAPFAYSVAERIRMHVAGSSFPIRNGTERMNITISIGIATTQAGDTPESLIKRADEALYRAKAEGRNRVVAPAA